MVSLEMSKSEPEDGLSDVAGPTMTSGIPDISSIVGNMVLAHELIVNEEFKLTSYQDNTMEKAVKEVIHKAFWDNLQEQLDSSPPNYENALQLLKEIKEILLSLMGPQNNPLKSQLNEVLDMELIAQEVSHDCFDLEECARFIILIMGKLCAPIRDEEVKSLRTNDGIIPTLRGILEFLDVMKLDMANFQLQSLKPYLMQQCIDYERGKFKEYLEANPDGITLTREWLKNAIEEIERLVTSSSSNQNAKDQSPKTESKSRTFDKITPSLVVTHAYLKLLSEEDAFLFPETLIMDELRLNEMRYMFGRLALIGSVMLITSNIVGQHLATDASFIKKLKDDLFILLDGVPNSELSKLLPNIADQVLSKAKQIADEREIKFLNSEQTEMLKSQIYHILDGKSTVHCLIKSRIRDYVLLCMTSDKNPKHIEAPLALAHVQEELNNLSGRFSRLIIHNRNVYMPVYEDIFNGIIDKQMVNGSCRTDVGEKSHSGESE